MGYLILATQYIGPKTKSRLDIFSLTCDEKEDIDNPPDAKSSQRQEFANSGPGLVQAETIQACQVN